MIKKFLAIAFLFCLPASALAQVAPNSVPVSSSGINIPVQSLNGGLGQYSFPLPPSGTTDWMDGDSLMAGYLASSCSGTSSNPSGTCFADLIAIHDGAKEINNGVSGTCLEYTTVGGSVCNNNSSTVGSLISRYQHDALTLQPGMRAYLLIGGNDVISQNYLSDTQVNPTTFRANLVTVTSYIANIVGAQNLILGQIPFSRVLVQINPQEEAQYNAIIADVATQYGYRLALTENAYPACQFANLTDSTCTATGDQIHPDTTGHTYFASAFENATTYNSVIARESSIAEMDLFNFMFPQLVVNDDTMLGIGALGYITSAATNDTALGFSAGQYITGGTTANITSTNSIYIGSNTKAAASGDNNETVIGYNRVGLGNASIAIQSGNQPGFFSGTGAPTFSAPNASIYLRYDGGTGTRWYANTSGASTSGTTWSAQTAP